MMDAGRAATDTTAPAAKIHSILNECCGRAASCRLHLLHSGHVIDATFDTLGADRLVLHVGTCQRDDMLLPAALCCVAFPFQQSLYAFIGCLNKVRDGDAALEVHFDVPATMAVTNLRGAFRVPVVRGAGLELTVLLGDGTRISADALNVSETGAEIGLSSDDDRLAVDTEVQFELRFRDEQIELSAIVRRRQQLHRALQFTTPHPPDSRRKLVALQRIVRLLEQHWLKSRLA
jgi:hypothetical protein